MRANLADAGDTDAVVADRADDPCHMGAMAVAVLNVRARRVCVEICAIDVVHDACTQSSPIRHVNALLLQALALETQVNLCSGSHKGA